MEHAKIGQGMNFVRAQIARAVCGLAVSAFAFVGVPVASAQYALGNGQGLQKNLSRFGSSSSRNDPLGASRFQNSVLYGNAANGKSFQGNLGYRNPSDFQGRLGSNDLYNFTRDSAFSGAASQGIRGSQLNDFQGALSRGERGLSAQLGGSFDVQRQGTTYGRGSAIAPIQRGPAGRRDQFRAPALGNLRASEGASSYDASTFQGDSLRSTLRSSLAASLSSNLGQPRGSMGSRAPRTGPTGFGGSGFGAENLLADSLPSLRTSGPDRSLIGADRALGLSGVASDSIRDRARSAPSQPRPGQVPSTKVGGSTGAGLGPNLAVPQPKTSFDELQDRLNKLDASDRVPSAAPADRLPDVLPGTRPERTSPSNDPGAEPSTNPDGTTRDQPSNPDGLAGSSRSVPMTWQARMDDLRGQLAGEPGKSGKVSLLGKPTRTRGYVERFTQGNNANDRTSGEISGRTSQPAKSNAGTAPDSLRANSGNDLPPRGGIPASKLPDVPERFRDKAGNPSDSGLPGSKIDPRTLKLIRDAGVKVETLKPAGAPGKDFFAEHMQAGERLLGETMYFDAEERFGKAISINGGDVTGHVGRVHAQIGSGLFRSAGFGLRKVLAAFPEATAQRYGATLLPSKARLDQVTARMRENLAAESTVDGPTRRDLALLLAYIGFQTTDRNMAEEGIAAMSNAVGLDLDAKPGEDNRLIELLRGVWLDDSFYKAAEEAKPETKPETK